MSKKRIILVEDEKDMADLVAMQLRREHYEVMTAHDGNDGMMLIRREIPDLVLLDLMLPGMSGMEIASQMKGDQNLRDIPIIMLTAKGEDADVVVGLQLGADDYITKPFSMKILIARISAVLRRSETRDESPIIETLGLIKLDRGKHEVSVADKPVILTLTEFRILESLIAARGRVLNRNQLIDKALGFDAVVTDRTIDVHINSLRKKLGKARDYVHTVRGIGYRFTGEE
ncbi:MAG TPA: response regulator [Phycisphaerae bacterium]|nr:response regulator [Phycisphaerae bacterium]HPS52864.1 response regulator [Phycisphaerae bacterium]